jgi:hypothetical protein
VTIRACLLQAHKIMKQAAPMRERRKELEAKNSLLRGMARDSSTTVAHTIDVESMAAEWDALLAGLTQLEANLDRQRDELAKQVGSNVARFMIKVDALRSKWLEVKPGGAWSSLSSLCTSLVRAWFCLRSSLLL